MHPTQNNSSSDLLHAGRYGVKFSRRLVCEAFPTANITQSRSSTSLGMITSLHGPSLHCNKHGPRSLDWIAPLYTAIDEGESSLGPRWSCARADLVFISAARARTLSRFAECGFDPSCHLSRCFSNSWTDQKACHAASAYRQVAQSRRANLLATATTEVPSFLVQ
jgi:hypothetical protein